MSRLLKALQQIQTELSPAGAFVSANPGAGSCPEKPPSSDPNRQMEQAGGSGSNGCQEPLGCSKIAPSLAAFSQNTDSGFFPREGMALKEVIQRLRARKLPGREPGYCQMAAHILEQVAWQESAIVLFFSLPSEPPPTSTVAPLAAVLGEAMPVPILGLDARTDQPELVDCFGLACRWTVGNLLQGEVSLYEAVRKTSLGELFLLAGVGQRHFPWQDLSEEAWAALIRQLRKQYRLVLIDGGSLPHPAQKVLLAHTDGVYLMVHLGRTPKGPLHRTVEELQQAGIQVLGCIAANSTKKP